MLTNLSRPATKKALKRLEKKNFALPDGLSELVTRRTLEAIGVLAGRMVTTKNVERVLQDSRTRATVQGQQVTNDAAERGVALIQRFQAWTKGEQQRQMLFIMTARLSRERRLEWPISSLLLLEPHPPTT